MTAPTGAVNVNALVIVIVSLYSHVTMLTTPPEGAALMAVATLRLGRQQPRHIIWNTDLEEPGH